MRVLLLLLGLALFAPSYEFYRNNDLQALSEDETFPSGIASPVRKMGGMFRRAGGFMKGAIAAPFRNFRDNRLAHDLQALSEDVTFPSGIASPFRKMGGMFRRAGGFMKGAIAAPFRKIGSMYQNFRDNRLAHPYIPLSERRPVRQYGMRNDNRGFQSESVGEDDEFRRDPGMDDYSDESVGEDDEFRRDPGMDDYSDGMNPMVQGVGLGIPDKKKSGWMSRLKRFATYPFRKVAQMYRNVRDKKIPYLNDKLRSAGRFLKGVVTTPFKEIASVFRRPPYDRLQDIRNGVQVFQTSHGSTYPVKKRK